MSAASFTDRARDDLADELDDLADRLPFGSPTVSRAVLDEDRRNLREAAEALRSPDSEARVDLRIGLTVIAQTGDGPLRGRIESIDGDNVQMKVGEAWWECVSQACLYADEHAPPDPAPDRVAECSRCHDDGGWTDLHGGWEPCPDCSDRVAEGEVWNLYRCPKCGILGENTDEVIQGWHEPRYPDDDGYTEDYFHECPDLGPEDDLRRVEELTLVQRPAPDRVAEGINLPPPSKHERQVLAGQDSPEADAMFEKPVEPASTGVREDEDEGDWCYCGWPDCEQNCDCDCHGPAPTTLKGEDDG